MKLHVGEQEGLWNYLHVSYLLFLVEKFKEYTKKKDTFNAVFSRFFPMIFIRGVIKIYNQTSRVYFVRTP